MNSSFVDAHSIVDYYTRQLEKPLENYAGYVSRKALDEFSLQLVNYRIEHQLNQTELAQELGITQPMVSQYEAGTNNISIKRLCELCEKIGVRVQLSYEDAHTQLSRDSYDPFMCALDETKLDVA
ncbi:MAG: helix-turn-helix transcriptional regulator [Clostridia bacterium]|nr:helix-turn-helix transcriptional regulator [Clostridia bacterium]